MKVASIAAFASSEEEPDDTMGRTSRGAFARIVAVVEALETASAAPHKDARAWWRALWTALPAEIDPDLTTRAAKTYLRSVETEDDDLRRRRWATEALTRIEADGDARRALGRMAKVRQSEETGEKPADWRRVAAGLLMVTLVAVGLGRAYTLKITRVGDTVYVHDVVFRSVLVCEGLSCARPHVHGAEAE